MVLLDAIRLRQIIFNLIGNSVKFTTQGSISLALKTLAIYENNTKVDILITVQDTGKGIPKDQLQKIFEEFEQTDGQDNREFGGTGLGLAISKRLTEMMGGEISVESKENEGSTFRVKLTGIEVSSAKTASQNIQTEQEIVKDEAKHIQIDLSAVLQNESLCKILKEDVSDLFTKVQQSSNMQDIKNFFEALEIQARAYGEKDLYLYLKALKEALDAFDVVAIQNLLQI